MPLKSSFEIPQGLFKSTKNPRYRVEFAQQIVDPFWKMWTNDVFPLLIPRRKWNVNCPNVRVNDIVMIVDEMAQEKMNYWKNNQRTARNRWKDTTIRLLFSIYVLNIRNSAIWTSTIAMACTFLYLLSIFYFSSSVCLFHFFSESSNPLQQIFCFIIYDKAHLHSVRLTHN